MMDPEAMKWANENPDEFRKQRNRQDLQNEIQNLESKAKVLRLRLEKED